MTREQRKPSQNTPRSAKGKAQRHRRKAIASEARSPDAPRATTQQLVWKEPRTSINIYAHKMTVKELNDDDKKVVKFTQDTCEAALIIKGVNENHGNAWPWPEEPLDSVHTACWSWGGGMGLMFGTGLRWVETCRMIARVHLFRTMPERTMEAPGHMKFYSGIPDHCCRMRHAVYWHSCMQCVGLPRVVQVFLWTCSLRTGQPISQLRISAVRFANGHCVWLRCRPWSKRNL